jgi:hypothetical protein
MSRWLSVLLVVLVIVVPAVGVAVVAWRLTAVPEEFEVAVMPVVARPTQQVLDGAVGVTLRAATEPGLRIVAAGGDGGTVTSVLVAPGDEVAGGTVVYTVDRVARVAVVTPEPFHRNLAAGSTGEDVRQLEAFLAARELFSGEPDNRYDRTTGKAVDAWAADLGVAVEDRTGTFLAEWALWLPTDSLVANVVAVEAGQPAPVAGQTVLEGPPVVSQISAAAINGTGLESGRAYEVWQGGTEVGQIASVDQIPLDLLAALTAERPLDQGGGAGSNSEVLYVVELHWTEEREVLTTASAAVMTGPDGDGLCVWAAKGDGYEAITVQVVGGSVGTSQLEPSPELAAADVLLNPLEVLDKFACP